MRKTAAIPALALPLFLVTLALLNVAGIQPATAATADTPASDFESLATMMTGSFSSQAQAEADTNFFDIRLEMKPIWQDRAETGREVWFYVEQAAAWSLDKPYRQRVYHVTDEGGGVYRSMVFSLPDPEAAIGAWRQEQPLADIGPDDLQEREGCAVYLRRLPDGSFRGATRERECTSSLRGATYATSEITILDDRIVSWDRGWDDADEQVWGAETAGYVFLRSEKP